MRSLWLLLLAGCADRAEPTEPPGARHLDLLRPIYLVTDGCLAAGQGIPWQDRAPYAAERERYARLAAEADATDDADLISHLFGAGVYCEDPELAGAALAKLDVTTFPPVEACTPVRLEHALRCQQRDLAVAQCCVDSACTDRPGCAVVCATFGCPGGR